MNQPFSLVADGHGNLYMVDFRNFRIRRVDLTANPPNIYLEAGNGGNNYSAGVPPTCTGLTPTTVATDGSGDLFFADGTGRIGEIVDAAGSAASSVAETVNVSPAGVGLQFSVNGASTSAPQSLSWSLNSSNLLSAAASQQGTDGVAYQLAGWSNGVANASNPVTAACPTAYTALYSPAGCTFSLSSNSALLPSDGLNGPGASGYFEISAPPGSNCSWVAVSQNPSWLTITGNAAGSGSGLVSFAATSNDSSTTSRTGTIQVAGQTFTVTQLPGGGGVECSFFITQPAYNLPVLPANGGDGLFFPTPSGTCALFSSSQYTWSASTDSSWLHVVSTASSDSSVPIVYSADAYTGTSSRTGNVLLTTPTGALQYSVTQAPAGANWALSATAASALANGNTGSVEVAQLASACSNWTAASNASWITVDSPAASASGSGQVAYTVAANTGAQRAGTLTIAGQTFTVTQAGGGSCSFGLSSSSALASNAGQSGSFSLTASNPLCYWSAVSSTPAWLTLTTADDGAGAASIGWMAAANGTGSARSATIAVGGQTFTVTQGAPGTAITIQTSPAGLQIMVDGAAYTAPQTLTLSLGTHSLAVSPTQAGAAGTQYAFTQWSDGNTSNPRTITVTSSSAAYTAAFQTQYQLTIAASPAAGGTVTPTSGGYYNAGASVAIGAAANTGYAFSGWTGSVASASSASTTVTMSAPESITAIFIASGVSGLAFYPAPPCRVADTRAGQGFTGQFGPPTMAAGQIRSFTVPASACNIPSTAQAYSLNITVVPPAALGYLTAWPTGLAQPYVSTLNSSNGAIIANAAIVPAGAAGAISIYVSDATDVIIDINGYFAAPTGSTALAFYPVTPCRVADTRNGTGPFGGPSLPAGGTRTFTVPQSACGIPSNAQAYSLNMTVVPPGLLDYLTVWPAGQTQPYVSTLNALQGQVAANAAIVPAGTNGAISVYVSDPSQVVIDINGYFAPAGGSGALYFYPVTPCRVADTRNPAGTFGGPSLGAGSTRTFPIPSSSCGLPSTAQAYSFNMTAVPPGSLFYLTTWPAGQSQPVVSTLNDLQGQIIANAAIVPAGTGSSAGGISVYVSDATNLVIDVNGYFGQ